MDIVITGSSGLIGLALSSALSAQSHRVITLVRREPKPGTDEIRWDPLSGKIDSDSLEGVDAVIHLAGAGIGDRRWSKAYRQVLVDSRVNSTGLLAKTMASATRPPARFLSGSAIGFYGNRGDEPLDETSSQGQGFLPDLVNQWETAAAPAIDAGIPTAMLRTGIVLSKAGGALQKLLTIFKIGLGGRMGSGQQFMSWITIDDQVRAIIELLDSPIVGPVNLTAPGACTNKDFTAALGSALRRPAVLPVPAFGPKLLLGSELAQALLFDSANVKPAVLVDHGFEFLHPTLDVGLESILSSPVANQSN